MYPSVTRFINLCKLKYNLILPTTIYLTELFKTGIINKFKLQANNCFQCSGRNVRLDAMIYCSSCDPSSALPPPFSLTPPKALQQSHRSLFALFECLFMCISFRFLSLSLSVWVIDYVICIVHPLLPPPT